MSFNTSPASHEITALQSHDTGPDRRARRAFAANSQVGAVRCKERSELTKSHGTSAGQGWSRPIEGCLGAEEGTTVFALRLLA